MRANLLALSIAAGLFAVGVAHADEGMWVPQQLPQIAGPLADAGLKLPAEQLADLTGNPMGAVVSLGGCTASFVSPQGLVATNHHCAYGAIQLNSTAENNLIKNGFAAASQADELSAGPNARIYVLDEITDVTAQANAAIAAAGNNGLARMEALERFEKAQIAACESEAGYNCRLYAFAGGNTYRLFKNLEIRDVRLAYAPPSGVGKYGGDIDNWMWPRHTGDFSFYRAYVGKDGKPAAYSQDNVPYQPRHHLQFADQPLGEGDFVMVAGYPGRTNRYALASEFNETAQYTYPLTIKHIGAIIDLVEKAGAADEDIKVKYANSMASWNNVTKNYEGQLEGFQRIDAAATKQAEEAAVLAWLKSRGRAGKAALDAHAQLTGHGKATGSTRERDLFVGQFQATPLLSTAITLYRLAIEKTKDDAERAPGYQQRNLPTIEGGLRQMDRRYHPQMDQQIQAYWLNQYLALPAGQRNNAVLEQFLADGGADALVARLAGSELGSLDARLKWLGADRTAFEASNDPAIQYAVAAMPALLEQEAARKTRAGEALSARATYLQAVADYKQGQGQFVYPDANSSLRITFGNVTGYAPKDGMAYTAFTTLAGVTAKATGIEPFDAPQALLDAVAQKRDGGLADARIGSVPVNFLSDLDITGGNSGSPVLDANGKLVGLAFDGNWESVSSNWVFDSTMTRMIAVDSRYIQWIMQEVYPAPALLQELDLQAR